MSAQDTSHLTGPLKRQVEAQLEARSKWSEAESRSQAGQGTVPPAPRPTPPRRKRGAPRGNHNAFKHGFYSQVLRPQAQFDLNDAKINNDLEAEISLLRVTIKGLAADTQYDRKELAYLLRTLSLLVSTQYRIAGERLFWNENQAMDSHYYSGFITPRETNPNAYEPPPPPMSIKQEINHLGKLLIESKKQTAQQPVKP